MLRRSFMLLGALLSRAARDWFRGEPIKEASVTVQAIGTRKALVILADFAGTGAPARTQAEVEALMVLVRQFLARISCNRATMEITVTPWLSINAPDPSSVDAAKSAELRALARDAATAAGYDLSAYTHRLIWFDSHAQSFPSEWGYWVTRSGQIGWGGGEGALWGMGSLFFTQARAARVLVGHGTGLQIDGFLVSGTAGQNHNWFLDQQTSHPANLKWYWDADGETITYRRQWDTGDLSSFMGASGELLDPSPIQREMLGWMEPRLIVAAGTYALPPYNTGDPTACLKFAGHYYLTYSQDPLLPARLRGVRIHVNQVPLDGALQLEQHSPSNAITPKPLPGSNYYDTPVGFTPPGPNLHYKDSEAALMPGESWTEPLHGVRIEVLSMDANGAQVRLTGDLAAPVVQITNLTDGQHVQGGSVKAKIQAQDNIGVQRVELWCDGHQVGVSMGTTATIPCQLTKGTHTIQAKAFDAAGNVGVSPILTVIRP